MTNILRTHRLDVTSVARLARGKAQSNPRPNQYLDYELAMNIEISGDKTEMETKISEKPHHSQSQTLPKHLTAVIRSIRDGKDKGRYLIVDDSVLDDWDSTVYSPLGAVDKKDIDPVIEVCLIHDLSFPDGDSTNFSFDKVCVLAISYKYVSVSANRIEELAVRFLNLVIRMLKGDVKSAYRHLTMSSQHVHWMAARLPEEKALIVDLSAPFGWSGSPRPSMIRS
ncbi:hypothetical protein PHMEG_00014111 [Phytophthora megakarya]|uniref:Reverse transcriptase n=1 Tax=Phytophthora megakarya TaxID=4795 RepID=A0A225W659_9STRA|nr:hypothetical protein PHMEG_00014111 [Phytophthora megakarya]